MAGSPKEVTAVGNSFEIGGAIKNGKIFRKKVSIAHKRFGHYFFSNLYGRAPRALCVEMGFTWTFPRNQDGTVKLKSELICIKF